jgi:hypothetical protein
MASHLSKSGHHDVEDDYENQDTTATAYQMMPLPSPKLQAKACYSKGKGHKGTKSQCGHSHSQSGSELNLRPETDLVKQDSTVLGGGDIDERDSALSRVSDDSQRMIITKKTEFTMETDRASFRLDQGSNSGTRY